MSGQESIFPVEPAATTARTPEKTVPLVSQVVDNGDPVQDVRRTWEILLPRLITWLYERRAGLHSHPADDLRAA